MTRKIILLIPILIILFQNCEQPTDGSINSQDGSGPPEPVDQPPDLTPPPYLTPQEPDLSQCTRATALPLSGPAPLSIGIDTIVPGEIYVVYSGIDKSAASAPFTADETASIILIRGKPVENSNLRQVWIFGAGYGNPNAAVKDIRTRKGLNHEVVHSAAFDVENVDYVIQNCFGMSVNRTEIQFLAPHGHVDHANQEFFEELKNKAYPDANLKIYVAAPDRDLMLDQFQNSFSDWTVIYETKVVTLGQSVLACNESIFSFQGATGEIRVLGNPDHTLGTINLHHLGLNYMFMGAGAPACDFSGAQYYFDAHKRLYWRTTPPAVGQIGLLVFPQEKSSSQNSHTEDCF